MSSDNSNPQNSPPGSGRRRSSFADMFAPRPMAGGQNNPPRRLSVTTLGLSTMPNAQAGAFNSMRARAESVSSANSGSVDESPFEEDGSPNLNNGSSMPPTPFARRMSFGAKALREGRNNGSPNSNASTSPTVGLGIANEGFDFAERVRARAERSSISGPSFSLAQQQQAYHQQQQQQQHHRSKSIAAAEAPPRELPKQPKVPDAFQERILKGDFYMD